MNKETAEALILHFAQKYLAEILPQDTFNHLDLDTHKASMHQSVQEWDRKVAMTSHWDGVLETQGRQEIDHAVSVFKQALFDKTKLWLQYEGRDKRFQFNPFGLVIRDQQCFFIGSFWDDNDPFLLSARKVQYIQLTDEPCLSPEDDFNLEQFSSDFLNHPQSSPEIIAYSVQSCHSNRWNAAT